MKEKKMKEKKIIIAAKAAKAAGYEYMTSVVKSHMNSTYYHYVPIDRVIAAGRWIPAVFNDFGWHGRVGVTARNVPKRSINKSEAIRKYCGE